MQSNLDLTLLRRHREQLENEHQTLISEDLICRARDRLISFTVASKHDYSVNWHHIAVAEILERVLSGELKRVVIIQPPQTGKSELVSRRFPAFAFGKRPDLRIIAGTYGKELASKNNIDIQNVMDSELYRHIFPGTMIPGHYADDYEGKFVRNSTAFSVVTSSGGYRCAGVGGSITGFPGDIFIMDDLLKNREEADSPVIRQKTWDWMTSTARTRLNKNGAIILTMTRWHQDDPVGRVLDLMKDDPEADQYEVFNFPSLAEFTSDNRYDNREPGVALWPEKYDEPYLRTTKASSGSRDWNSLYQGSPVSQEGSIIKRKWLKFYKQLPDTHMQYMQSWDLSFDDKASSSRTAGGVFCRDGANIYLMDVVKGIMNFPTQKQAVRTFSAKWPQAYEKVIEHKANAAALIAELQNEIGGMIPFDPKGSKEQRAMAASPCIEAGNFWLPDPSIAPWVHDVVTELCDFPTGRYNDVVDMIVQAILRFRQGSAAAFTRDLLPRQTSLSLSKARRRW